jgi:hypothetical protein
LDELIEAFFMCEDEVDGRHHLEGCPQFVVGGVGAAESEVGLEGAGQKHRGLGDI